MAFGQNKNLRVKILKSFIWYKSTQNLMEINSFRAFFKFLSGKYFLSIYVSCQNCELPPCNITNMCRVLASANSGR